MKEKSLRSTLWHFDFALSGLALTALIILTSVGVVARYFLHEPITWLEEVQMISDRVTVFRDGCLVGTDVIENMPRDRIVQMMIAGYFITRCHTVTGYDCAIHDLCRIHKCRYDLFCIHSIIISIMQQSL